MNYTSDPSNLTKVTSSPAAPDWSPTDNPQGGFVPKVTASTAVPVTPNTEQQADWSHATQDLLDALPRVWTRGLLYGAIAFTAIALPWASLSQVDETGTARGRLEPQETPFKVDSPVAGAVAQVLVKEGQKVSAQQPLLKIDSSQIDSQLEQTRTQLEGHLNRLVQLEMLKNQLLLAVRTQEQQNQSQQSEKLTQIEQVRQQHKANQTTRQIVVRQLQREKSEVDRYKKLWQVGAIAEIEVVSKERIAEESQQKLAQAEAEIRQAALRLKEQQNSYQSLMHAGDLAVLKSNEQLKDLEAQITALQAEIAQNKSQIRALETKLAQHIVKAPVSGIVFDLPIKQPGAFVQPSTFVTEIAPENAPLILRAQIATPESGSLKKGMPVKLKFDAFPFKDYGVIKGRLTKISPTSKILEPKQSAIATFDIEVELDQTCIRVEATCVELTPGQTATAEIIIRQRRVIDFILDPFRQLQQGGLDL